MANNSQIPGDDESSAIDTDAPDALEGDEDDKSDDKILADARARLQMSEDAEGEIRRLALEDLEFRSGKQWPDKIQQDRERDGRPCLVINRIPQFIQQVTNDQRQNRPAIKVHPVDDDANVETGKIIQGIIRHIEYNSSADTAYDTAFEGAATGGFGYFRIVTDFASPTSFEQEIMIKRIRNPFSVFFDPYSQEPDGSDASFAFITEDLSGDEYRNQYPDSKLSGEDDWDSIGNIAPGWAKEGSARVAEYFYKEYETRNLCLLSTGETVYKEELEHVLQIKAQMGQAAELVRERSAKVPVIKWVKMNAVEILEKTDWPGVYIPIVPVYGAELYVNGKRILESVIRNAKDPQRMYNYWASAETEAIALAPRTPFIAAEGQIEDFENDWATANKRNHSVLKYKPTSLGGVAVPPPQRQSFEPAVQAITQARMVAADDLKATTGIYDASLGAQSPDTSGIAIQRRNNQAQTSNFHFVDNLSRSLKHAGRILVDLIPRIYDTARSARIVKEDGEQQVVKVNQPFDLDGKPVIYSLDAGRYDVTVDVGPSFASKRQEAAASMIDISKSYPQIMEVAGDLLVKNMDWPGSQEISERLKKMLPPQLQQDASKGQPPLPPQVQAQMQQMNQMIEQLTKNLHAAHDKLDTKQIERESHERIEMAKIQADIEIQMAKMGSQESIVLLKHEISAIENRLKLLNFNQPVMGDPQNQVQAAPPAFGAPQGAGIGAGQPQPTGGQSPGSPMEGISNVDPSQNF